MLKSVSGISSSSSVTTRVRVRVCIVQIRRMTRTGTRQRPGSKCKGLESKHNTPRRPCRKYFPSVYYYNPYRIFFSRRSVYCLIRSYKRTSCNFYTCMTLQRHSSTHMLVYYRSQITLEIYCVHKSFLFMCKEISENIFIMF